MKNRFTYHVVQLAFISSTIHLLFSACVSDAKTAPTTVVDTKTTPPKADQSNDFRRFLGEYYFELTMSDDEPPVTSDCAQVGEAEITKMGSSTCEQSDEFTQMFWDWNCSLKGSAISTSVVLGGKPNCEKSLAAFRARY